MKYILVQYQDAGCDYTIGCGLSLTDLSATTVEGAKREAFDQLSGRWRERDGFDATISKARILAVVADIDPAPEFDQWVRGAKEADAIAKAVEDAAKDRAEFERLKAKFGE